jgi:hypothetical protein
MGAINFNPAQVIERLSRDRGGEISRLATLARGHRQNRIFALGPEAKNPGPTDLLIGDSREIKSLVVYPPDLLNRQDSENEKSGATPANLANLLNYDPTAEWLKGVGSLDPSRPPADLAVSGGET